MKNAEKDKENLIPMDIPKQLLKWYDTNKRCLPWREDPTPYKVWVSEIMLQQTRVEAVKLYFQRFMEVLPDIESLAKAEEEQLLKLWEGLGYYNRVRNLQKAAIQIVEEFDGKMPAEYEGILKLKGIGTYTAGAIASIAFGVAVPAVDGNVLRVLSRIREDERLISDSKVKTAVEQELLSIMPADRPGDFNQALMELGACVCIPNGAPKCEICPVANLCKCCQNDTQYLYPQKEKKKERQIEEKTILVIRDEKKVALRKRPNKGLLAGMYEFPWLEGEKSADEVTRFFTENQMKIIRIVSLPKAKHIFTHKEWHMTGYMIWVDELAKPGVSKGEDRWLFVEPLDTKEHYPIPSAFAAYTHYFDISLGNKRLKEGK